MTPCPLGVQGSRDVPAALVAQNFPAALVAQNRALADLTRVADPDTPVPTCPDWTLRHLVTHVGRGDPWAATTVAERAEAFVDPRTVPDGKPSADPGEAAGRLTGGVRLLIDAVEGVGPETSMWTFLGPRPAAWWLRRRLHEATVHRADATLALNAPFDLPADVAADGVSEWLSLLAARPRPEPPLEGDTTMHLHATDDGIGAAWEWMVRGGGGGIEWDLSHRSLVVAAALWYQPIERPSGTSRDTRRSRWAVHDSALHWHASRTHSGQKRGSHSQLGQCAPRWRPRPRRAHPRRTT